MTRRDDQVTPPARTILAVPDLMAGLLALTDRQPPEGEGRRAAPPTVRTRSPRLDCRPERAGESADLLRLTRLSGINDADAMGCVGGSTPTASPSPGLASLCVYQPALAVL
ncbi:hypothetical protein ABZY45_13395 [Streptomyces sp. NPDC006516]|uniref:hypothetical protein n=1 Tax=Streptomyces sp. NPDC006516 TaxID=3154309 RepID=UPI0033AB6B8D